MISLVVQAGYFSRVQIFEGSFPQSFRALLEKFLKHCIFFFCLFKVSFFTFYDGKSPLNHHLGNVLFFSNRLKQL